FSQPQRLKHGDRNPLGFRADRRVRNSVLDLAQVTAMHVSVVRMIVLMWVRIAMIVRVLLVRVLVIVGVRMRMHGAIWMPMLMRMRVSVLMRMDVVCRLRRLSRTIRFAVNEHIDLRRSDATAVHLLDLEFPTEIQRLHRFAQQVRGNAGIYQRAQEHISTDPGKTLDVGDAHEPEPLLSMRSGEYSIVVGARLGVKPAALLQ